MDRPSVLTVLKFRPPASHSNDALNKLRIRAPHGASISARLPVVVPAQPATTSQLARHAEALQLLSPAADTGAEAALYCYDSTRLQQFPLREMVQQPAQLWHITGIPSKLGDVSAATGEALTVPTVFTLRGMSAALTEKAAFGEIQSGIAAIIGGEGKAHMQIRNLSRPSNSNYYVLTSVRIPDPMHAVAFMHGAPTRLDVTVAGKDGQSCRGCPSITPDLQYSPPSGAEHTAEFHVRLEWQAEASRRPTGNAAQTTAALLPRWLGKLFVALCAAGCPRDAALREPIMRLLEHASVRLRHGSDGRDNMIAITFENAQAAGAITALGGLTLEIVGEWSLELHSSAADHTAQLGRSLSIQRLPSRAALENNAAMVLVVKSFTGPGLLQVNTMRDSSPTPLEPLTEADLSLHTDTLGALRVSDIDDTTVHSVLLTDRGERAASLLAAGADRLRQQALTPLLAAANDTTLVVLLLGSLAPTASDNPFNARLQLQPTAYVGLLNGARTPAFQAGDPTAPMATLLHCYSMAIAVHLTRPYAVITDMYRERPHLLRAMFRVACGVQRNQPPAVLTMAPPAAEAATVAEAAAMLAAEMREMVEASSPEQLFGLPAGSPAPRPGAAPPPAGRTRQAAPPPAAPSSKGGGQAHARRGAGGTAAAPPRDNTARRLELPTGRRGQAASASPAHFSRMAASAPRPTPAGPEALAGDGTSGAGRDSAAKRQRTPDGDGAAPTGAAATGDGDDMHD